MQVTYTVVKCCQQLLDPIYKDPVNNSALHHHHHQHPSPLQRFVLFMSIKTSHQESLQLTKIHIA